MANNKTKYIRVDPAIRQEYQATFNKPVLWPLWLVLFAVLALLLPAYLIYRRIERSRAL